MDTDLAAAVVPYVAAAAGAYGTAVLERVRDSAADSTAEATVGLGRRLLRRILQREESAAHVSAAVEDLVQDPNDADSLATVRMQIRKALAMDTQLAAEVAAMLHTAGLAATAAGTRSVAVRLNEGIIQTGDGSIAQQGRT